MKTHLPKNKNVEAGVRALRCERLKWSKTPEGLIRAARHYERAAQIIVKLTVDSVQKYMPQLSDDRTSRPGIGYFIALLNFCVINVSLISRHLD